MENEELKQLLKTIMDNVVHLVIDTEDTHLVVIPIYKEKSVQTEELSQVEAPPQTEESPQTEELSQTEEPQQMVKVQNGNLVIIKGNTTTLVPISTIKYITSDRPYTNIVSETGKKVQTLFTLKKLYPLLCEAHSHLFFMPNQSTIIHRNIITGFNNSRDAIIKTHDLNMDVKLSRDLKVAFNQWFHSDGTT